MDDVKIHLNPDVFESANSIKRSNRPKKKKKFFDDAPGELTPQNSHKGKIKPTKEKDQQPDVIDVVEIEASEKMEPAIQDRPVDDEEAWLDALEKGELDDNGDIPKTKDPSLMTARQKALLERARTSNPVENVSVAPKEELSEEAKRKREEKNRRRKLQAVKRAEENKKQTIEKLVQGSKLNKDQTKNSRIAALQNVPMIKYISSSMSTSLSFPEGFDYPLKAQKAKSPLPVRKCVQCGNPRKYDCSRTGASLCSFQCYKKNLNQVQITSAVS